MCCTTPHLFSEFCAMCYLLVHCIETSELPLIWNEIYTQIVNFHVFGGIKCLFNPYSPHFLFFLYWYDVPFICPWNHDKGILAIVMKLANICLLLRSVSETSMHSTWVWFLTFHVLGGSLKFHIIMPMSKKCFGRRYSKKNEESEQHQFIPV